MKRDLGGCTKGRELLVEIMGKELWVKNSEGGTVKKNYEESSLGSFMDKTKYWIQASRLTSQSYIVLPLFLGQAMAFSIRQEFSISLFLLIHLFGLFIQLFIVYANDFADFKADSVNNTYNIFSGGSRVLVEKKIAPQLMMHSILCMILLNFIIGIILSVFYFRPLALPIIILSLLLLWAYSYPPLKLSYRGGGEVLQVVGLAFVLPIFAYYIQTGGFNEFPWIILGILFPNHLASAFSTSLPDYPSDKLCLKRTAAVVLGPGLVRILIIMLNFTSIFLLWYMLPYPESMAIASCPVILNLGLSLLLRDSSAGSRRLFYFVFINLLQVMCFITLLALYYLVSV